MTSGLTVNTVNVIEGSAWITFQSRCVVGTDVDDILPDLRSPPDAYGLKCIEIFGFDQVRCAAARQDTDNIWVKRALASLVKALFSLCF